ncbi:hypothetical protein DITRI_Ditri13aG0116400 [Diplodiscus trichospermus]
MGSSNRRLTLFEQMSAVDHSRNNLVGLTLDDILHIAKRTEQPPIQNRTLLDVLRDDGTDKDKKSWKAFRDKLRLKRAGFVWTSSVPIPASDVDDQGNRSEVSRRVSFLSNSADSTHGEDGGESAPVSDQPAVNSRSQLGQSGSVRFVHNPIQTDRDYLADVRMPAGAPLSRSSRPSISHHHSTHLPSSNTAGNGIDCSDDESPVREGSRRLGAALEEERALSAREALAAQEAAEAAATAASAAAAAHNTTPPTLAAEEPLRMSLMDLLEETDRQMGLSGSRYTMGDDDDDDDDDEEEEDEKDNKVQEKPVEASGAIECTCCVCMVRHKGAAFIPCGHTFCRLCSRELWVQRGNCPLCNGFILEILDIF